MERLAGAAAARDVKAIERTVGRTPSFRNGPREIDVDILDFGGVRRAGPDPVLPHPRLSERRFVLAPLAEIAPRWRHPVSRPDGRGAAAPAAGPARGYEAFFQAARFRRAPLLHLRLLDEVLRRGRVGDDALLERDRLRLLLRVAAAVEGLGEEVAVEEVARR